MGFALAACRKEPEEQALFSVPAHFPAPHYQALANPLTREGVELGRRLFYEPLLSLTGEVSCATCHAQPHGFADHNVAFSKGIYGRLGRRNSPPIVNMAWNTSFMWDGGVNHIEIMPIAPLTDSVEMGETLSNIVAKLQAQPQYRERFRRAFGSDSITDQRLLYALAQFMTVLVSGDSQYDRYRQGKGSLDAQELQGLELFRLHCENCHREPLFTDYSFRNNGIDGASGGDDPGRERITLSPSDRSRFKVPTLRNIARTYPYMHDGRMTTLEAVLAHYAGGIKASPTLDTLLPAGGLGLSASEQAAIIAFLQTLNDYTYLNNPDFSDAF